MSRSLEEFLRVFAGGAAESRVIADFTVAGRSADVLTPFIIVRNGDRVVVLDVLAHSDHLCVDVHAFVDGEPARTGVFGMEDGRRYTLASAEGTSHGWPATSMVALLVGRQEERQIRRVIGGC